MPFPAASEAFYRKQGYLWKHNAQRTKCRTNFPVQKKEEENIGVNRSYAAGSLAENIIDLRQQLQGLTNTRNSEGAGHLKGCIAVAEELTRCMLLKTSDAYRIFRSAKTEYYCQTNTYRSVDAYETLAKYLNISQIYIGQTGYIVESNGKSIQNIVDCVNGMIQNYNKSAMTISKSITEALKVDFPTVLRYFDTKRDKDMLEAIVARITSVNCVVRLKGCSSKTSVQRNLHKHQEILETFKNIEKQSLVVRNDMTARQQYAFSLRKRKVMKDIIIRNIAKGSGRRLKCEEFPELAICLEYAFGEGDRLHRGGGGLEAHPKLLDTTLYKALDNATSMKQAKEFISAVNPDLKISLSTLYNYTMNYKKGTHQAKAHHHGKGITANISLHKPPTTAEAKHPINAHWSTANVNYLVDSSAQNPDSHLVDSKDAKCVVADV